VLVRREERGSLAIGQLSHAWLAGQLARAWGNTAFGAVEPREEIVLGAEQHDIGWASFDLEPHFNPDSGLPRAFVELSAEEHLAIWRGAPERLMSQSAHAALVVSLHGSALSELRARNAPADAELLLGHIDEERARQQHLRAQLGISQAHCERTQRQMWAWDGLSLALCNAWLPFTVQNVPCAQGSTSIELRERDDDGTATIEPWPFGGERLDLRCEARRLASSYPDAGALREAFARAELVMLEFTLMAPRGSVRRGSRPSAAVRRTV
jgi:Protein of unknown function (DUF3891)